MPPWYKRTLSSEEALSRANTHLENARDTKDRRRAQKLCDDAKESLERMDISKSIKDRDRIIAAYREHGKLLEKLGLADEAQLSYNKAEGLITTGQSAPKLPSTVVTTPISTLSSPPVSNATRTSNTTTPQTKKTVIPTIFTKDCPPPVIRYTFPGPDDRLVSTHQLAFCLALLQVPASSLDTLDTEARTWLKATERNQDEKDRLRTLATNLIRALVRDELKDRKAITEVVCLAPVLEKGDFRFLLSMFVNAIKDSLLLDVQALEGLAHLIQSAAPSYIDADDLVKILELLSIRLQGTFQQSPQHIYDLTITVSGVLDAMADSNIQGLDRVKLHEPLLSYLESLKANSDPYIVFRAAYAFQALLRVPDDEEPWQAVLRRSGAVIKGVGGLASAIKGLNIAEFIDGLSTIQEGFQGVGQIFALAQDAYNGVTALTEGGQGLLEALKDGLSFTNKRTWYAALRGADSLIQNGELIKFKTLVCDAPCRRDLAFQWGICLRLGYLAADPEHDDGSRKDAILFLGEMYWNDEEWGQEPRVKQCILDILLRLSQVSGNCIKGPMNAAAEDLLKDLATIGDVNKQKLYQASIQNGPSPYSWKVAASLPDSSALIDQVQSKPSVEPALRKYQRLRLQEQEQRHAVYIPPQAKATRESSDDDLFDLTTKVNEFITGDGEAKVLLLLGDSGAGKSTFNLELEKNLWKVYNTEREWIPVFVTLPAIDKPEEDLIAKQLRRYDFTDDQICELKSFRQFVLICDGYDECQKKDNLYNDNRLNQPGEWKVKMVISCRSEFLGSEYRLLFQPGGRNDRRRTTQLQEAVVAPFSKAKISDYIRTYAAEYPSEGDTVWRVEAYENAIKNIPNLQELVKNPFLLSLALEVLPRLVNLSKDFTTSRISRVTLYDEFVDQWVERGQKRLIERSLTGDDYAAFEILSEDGFTQNAIGFVKDLTVAIFDKQDGKPVVEYSPIRDKTSWKSTFFGQGDGKNLLRETCPLSRSGNQYRFIHRSVLEYGLARAVYEPHSSAVDMEDTVDQLSLEQESNQGDPIPTALSVSPLFRRSFVNESSIIDFLSERVQQSTEFKDQLYKLIDRSKSDARFSQAAANAITILVRAGVRFNGADLRGICVAGADLSCGDFDSARLQGADLRDTILENTWLRQADLSESQMDGVVFGQWPYLQMRDIVRHCVYSPDGTNLAVVLDDGSIHVYDTSTWSRLDFQGQADLTIIDQSTATSDHPDIKSNEIKDVSSVAFSPSGQQIILGSMGGTVQSRDVRTSTLCFNVSGHTDRVASVACSPDGKQIASGSSDKDVRLWDAQTGAPIFTLSGHTDRVTSVAYSPDSQQIASSSEDRTIRLWDARTFALRSILSDHTDYVRSVAYSPDGQQIVSCGDDKTVRLWETGTGALINVLSGHTGWVISVAFSPNGQQVASGGKDDTVRLWDVKTGSLISVLSGHTIAIESVAYSSCTQQIASGGFDRTVRLWRSQSTVHGFTLGRHTEKVLSVAYSPRNRRVASGSEDETVRLWDAQSGALVSTLSGHTQGVISVACSPSGQQIASGSKDNTVRLWDAESSALSHTLEGHSEYVLSVTYSPSGQQIASGSADTTVRLWDAETGALNHTLSGHTDYVLSVTFSPNGQQIASGSRDDTIRLWDALTGTPGSVLSGHTNAVCSVAYSPNGKQIASGSVDRSMRLWDTQTGALISTLTGHIGMVTSVAYSTGGGVVASGCVDETVRLWDVESGQCLSVLNGFQDMINAVTWMSDAYFVVGCDDKSVSAWKIEKEGNEVQVCLNWRSGPNKLVLSSATIQGVHGLSEMNARLFQQQQEAVDQLLEE